MAYDPTLVKNVYHPDLARAAYEREAAVDPQAWRNWEHEYEGNVFSLSEAPPEIYWVNYCLRRSPSAPPANPATGKSREPQLGPQVRDYSETMSAFDVLLPASGKGIEQMGEDAHPRMCRCLACMTSPAPPSDKVLVSREALNSVINTFGEMLFKGDFTQDEERQFGQPLAALRSELEGGE